jgi:hypothetical protein
MKRTVLALAAVAAFTAPAVPAHADPICVIVLTPGGPPVGGCAGYPFATECQHQWVQAGETRVEIIVCYPVP